MSYESNVTDLKQSATQNVRRGARVSGVKHVTSPARPSFKAALTHWLRHFLRVQLLAAVGTLVVFFATATSGASDSGPLQMRARIIAADARMAVKPHAAAGSGAKFIRAPIIDQLPGLYNGCEVTSLAMLLRYEGIRVTKDELAGQVRKASTPLVSGSGGQILQWGDPNQGFVGDMREFGYGVYHGPIAALLNRDLPRRSLDLTGSSFRTVLSVLQSGRPLIVWTTIHFRPTTDWVTWQSPDGPIRATMEEHAVLLVGFDKTTVFVNDPLTGQAAQPASLAAFRASWIQLGRQAITVTPPSTVTGVRARS